MSVVGTRWSFVVGGLVCNDCVILVTVGCCCGVLAGVSGYVVSVSSSLSLPFCCCPFFVMLDLMPVGLVGWCTLSMVRLGLFWCCVCLFVFGF